MPRETAIVLGVLAILCGCTSVRSTSPTRSAQEELLISTAADQAAANLAAQLPPNIRTYVDSSHLEAEDGPYAIAAIEDQLLRRGIRLTDDKAHADSIIILRSGALSTNERTMVVGLPPVSLPFFPLGNFLALPAFDLYAHGEYTGVAKFAASLYNPKTGRLIVSTGPQYGFSHEANWVVLFLFTWSRHDHSLDAVPDPNS